jgi:hypothetical protein
LNKHYRRADTDDCADFAVEVALHEYAVALISHAVVQSAVVAYKFFVIVFRLFAVVSAPVCVPDGYFVCHIERWQLHLFPIMPLNQMPMPRLFVSSYLISSQSPYYFLWLLFF